MNGPQACKGRHAAPSTRGDRSAGIPSRSIPDRTTGRRLAAAAAALAAGAVPLACTGSAAAATQADLPTLGLPNLALPFGLPDSIDPLAAGVPIARDLPLSQTVSTAMPPLGDIARVGDLGLLPERAPQTDAERRSATPARQEAEAARRFGPDTSDLANTADRLLTGQAQRAAARLADALPPGGLISRPAADSGGPFQSAADVLRQGALGKLTSGFGLQVDELADGVIGRSAPLVSQLRQSGVPTVGEVTGELSGTRLPMLGSVGSLTRALPVTSVLGGDSPVTGALQNLGSL